MILPTFTSMAITQKRNIMKDLSLHSNALLRCNYPTKDCSVLLDDFYAKHAQNLTDARHLLKIKVGKHSREGLVMVDTMQRLGINNYFQEEIELFLKWQYMLMTDTRVHQHKDLSELSLCFRLLRQEGYYVSADRVFGHFKGKYCQFKEIVGEDISGLVNLYEASQLSMKGENILEEAEKFSSQLLNEKMTFVDQNQATTARNTLKNPFHKSLARFTAKHFVGDLNCENECGKALQELARLDTNVIQSIHQAELLQVSSWWKDLGLAKEMKLARDQPLKWHMWPIAMLTDPSLSEERIDLTKPISLIYIIDDIFDVNGTIDELTLFTEAVNRWDIAAIEQLPNYMKKCFKALNEITNEIGYKIYKKHGLNPIESLKKTWASLCNAYLVEAKWFASRRLPPADEYLKNGIVSSGVHVVLVHMYFLLGGGSNNERADFLSEDSGIISSVAAILRLWDDLLSAKDENQDRNDGSYITCYLKEHQGASFEIAREHVLNMISENWKCLNKECYSPNSYSATFIKGCLNLARMVPLMCSYDENQSVPILEDYMKSILYDNTPLETINRDQQCLV